MLRSFATVVVILVVSSADIVDGAVFVYSKSAVSAFNGHLPHPYPLSVLARLSGAHTHTHNFRGHVAELQFLPKTECQAGNTSVFPRHVALGLIPCAGRTGRARCGNRRSCAPQQGEHDNRLTRELSCWFFRIF